jgi:hypothetical protein
MYPGITESGIYNLALLYFEMHSNSIALRVTKARR